MEEVLSSAAAATASLAVWPSSLAQCWSEVSCVVQDGEGTELILSVKGPRQHWNGAAELVVLGIGIRYYSPAGVLSLWS